MKSTHEMSDIKDGKTEEYLYEGDLVLLHNWGWGNPKEVIGVAILYYNTEYHQWDFHMIAGDYIDDIYDRWRQCPTKIGYYDGKCDVANICRLDEHADFVITDKKYVTYAKNWLKFIKDEQIKADIEYHKAMIEKEKIKLDDMTKKNSSMLKYHEEELKKLEDD